MCTMASQSTTILSLPFDIILNIVQYLPLKDALHLSNISTTAFDAVYYSFSHKAIVNFRTSLNATGTIDMTDNEILTVLHAHTRAKELQHFALPPTFTSFDQLNDYIWAYLILPPGQLVHIQAPHRHNHRPSFNALLGILDHHDEYGVYLDELAIFPESGQSYIDLDAPWKQWSPYGYNEHLSDEIYLENKQTENSWQYQLKIQKQKDKIIKANQQQQDTEMDILTTYTKEDLDEEYRQHREQELYESCFP